MKKYITWVIILLLVIIGVVVFIFTRPSEEINYQNEQNEINQTENESTSTENTNQENTETENSDQATGTAIIGKSVDGKNILAHRFGTGEKEVLFVGGIHGGYSWNTALLGFELLEYFQENPNAIPDGVVATIIPVLNPDGLESVVGTAEKFDASDVTANESQKVSGRFNSNNVDLNRNFDCDWQTTATWQNTNVDGGDTAFSEPESRAVRDYINQYNPDAVVVYYSSAGGVFASNCHNGVLSETKEILNVYANASGYTAFQEFDFYEITGDMTNWLAKEGIPAISILLTNHTNTEFSKNINGVKAVLNYFSN